MWFIPELPFNRTLLELKSPWIIEMNKTGEAFNRTLLELKYLTGILP